MINFEIIITTICVAGSLIVSLDGVTRLLSRYRKQSLCKLMNELADKNTPIKRQRLILYRMRGVLLASDIKISNGYIKDFNSDGRGKLSIFRDICTQNNIEPTSDLCIQMLGSDDAQFRRDWVCKQTASDAPASTVKPSTETNFDENNQLTFF